MKRIMFIYMGSRAAAATKMQAGEQAAERINDKMWKAIMVEEGSVAVVGGIQRRQKQQCGIE